MESYETPRAKPDEITHGHAIGRARDARSFRRGYKKAAIILTALCLPGLIGELQSERRVVVATMMFLLALVPLVPIFHHGGFKAYIRFPITLSVILCLVFGGLTGVVAYGLLRTGLVEGPNGEGVPIYGLVIVVFSGLFLFAPWLVSAIRGVPLWHANAQGCC